MKEIIAVSLLAISGAAYAQYAASPGGGLVYAVPSQGYTYGGAPSVGAGNGSPNASGSSTNSGQRTGTNATQPNSYSASGYGNPYTGQSSTRPSK